MKQRLISMKLVGLFVSALLILLLSTVVFADAGAPRVTTLSGSEEVVPGDPDGSGTAEIRLNHGQGTVCWEITYTGIDTPFAAHIHKALAGVNGPVVVPLNPINSGCTTAAKDLIKAITQNPEAYYVNVHNPAFPGGALRGQLSNPGQSE